MSLSGVFYRVRQFWYALTNCPDQEALQEAEKVISPELMELFLKMQPSEQVHSLRVFRKLRDHGETNQDLLSAALLHDVGKIVLPLKIWERVAIVLLQKFFLEKAIDLGEASATCWRKPLVVAQHHPEWGADIAKKAGASELTVTLIKRHQEALPGDKKFEQSKVDKFLALLQFYDDES